MKKRKILATVLSICTLIGTFGITACGGSNTPDNESGGGNSSVYNVPSASKMTIKVKNYGMGPGNIWLEETAERFAKLKQNEKYGDKTGVYIDINVTNNQNTSAMAGDGTNIFFDERASDPYALAQSGLLLNIDSIVKDDTRIGGSLESNIFDAAKGGIMGSDGSYYALPHYEFYTGLTYNRTTFESLNAYFAADDENNVNRHNSKYGSANFVGDKTAEKSVGPDGKKGTQDDGLPKSLEEFIILCDYIKTESDGKISPLTVSGTYYYYVDYLVMGIWATIAGSEQMKNYYNCTGEIEVVDRDENGNLKFTDENLFKGINYVKKPVTKKVTMAADGSQGWMGNDMAAKYYALAILDVVVNEGFFSASAKQNKSHWDTQMDIFMNGKLDTNNSAMLVEGSYWYNEADENGGLDAYEDYVGKNRNDLDLAWMNLPTSVYTDGAVGRDACFLDTGLAYTMVNGNIKNNPDLMRACLDFVAFCYTEEELAYFTAKTGIARAIKYNLTNEQKQSISIYARRLWEARDNVNGSNVITWSGTTDTFKKVKKQIKLDLRCGVLADDTNNDVGALFNNPGTHAAQALSALSLYRKWSNY